jgi:hypothetical protein
MRRKSAQNQKAGAHSNQEDGKNNNQETVHPVALWPLWQAAVLALRNTTRNTVPPARVSRA